MEIGDFIQKNWDLLAQPTVLILAVLCAIGGFVVGRAFHQRDIETLEHRIRLKDDEIAFLKSQAERMPREIAAASVPAQLPARERTASKGKASRAAEKPRPQPVGSEVDKPSRGREVVPADVTPRFLFSLYRDGTEAQGDLAAKEFLGKRMTVTGTVGDVSSERYGEVAVYLQIVPILPENLGDWMTHTVISLYFSEEKERVATLQKGDVLTAQGWIAKFDNMLLRLEGCEIVKIERAKG